MTAWVGVHLGLWSVPSAGMELRLWHAHEMLFGFAAAIVVGIMLTALPVWIRRGRDTRWLADGAGAGPPAG